LAVLRRHILLEGSLNLRDLGGYDSGNRRRIREGCVFRSDELHSLTDTDLEAVTRLGIRVVFDLRNAHERTARPNRLPVDVELLERGSPSAGGDPRTTEEQIARGELPVRDDEYFATVYVDLLDRLAPELRTILERAVDAPTRPLLFHCAAGKDRTGIVAAVLLGLLGVSEDVILDDYELTSTYFTPRRMAALADAMAEHRVPDDRVRPLLEARRPVLARALRHLYERWGDFDGYARQHLGVEADLPERLRAALLVPVEEAETRSTA
jgi:protein-tyrosine phosphatase